MKEVFHHFRIMFADHRMCDREIEPGPEAAHGMVHACAAQDRVALQKFVRYGAGFEADDPGGQAIFLGEFRVGLEIVEICLEIVRIVDPFVQFARHELIQRGAIRVESMQQLSFRPRFERHRKRQAVHFGVRESHSCHGLEVLFTVEIANRSGMLGKEEIVCGTHLRKCRNCDLAVGELPGVKGSPLFVRQTEEAVEQMRTGDKQFYASRFVDAGQHPASLAGKGRVNRFVFDRAVRHGNTEHPRRCIHAGCFRDLCCRDHQLLDFHSNGVLHKRPRRGDFDPLDLGYEFAKSSHSYILSLGVLQKGLSVRCRVPDEYQGSVFP